MTRPREAGFTLVEIVVSLALATLVLVGTLGFMNAQSRSHRDSMELQTMQMGLRVGLERVLRDARSASAGFNIGTISLQDAAVVTANPGVAALPAVWVGHTVPRGSLNSPNQGWNGSDELNLIFADGRGITNTKKDASGTISQSTAPQTITVMDTQNFTTVFPDNFVIISDVSNVGNAAARGILARVTAIGPPTAPDLPPAGTLTIGAMATTNAFPVPSFQGGSLIMTASAITYRISNSVFGTNEPALVMARGEPLGLSGLPNPDPLATQIEDLQVALGYDGLLGTTADKYITESPPPGGVDADEWAFNFPGDTLPLNPTTAIATLRTVRVTLVARSVNPRAIGVGPLVVEDHDPGTGAGHLRRRLTGVASVRNLSF